MTQRGFCLKKKLIREITVPLVVLNSYRMIIKPMNMKRVAIMQPTYLPWCGYFGLLDYVDQFVFLDNVQYSHQSWQQRNRIKGPSGEILLTVPVVGSSKRGNIESVLINSNSNPLSKHLKSLHHSYSNSKYFSEVISHLGPILNSTTDFLSDLNIALITEIAKMLGLSTPMLKASDLGSAGVRENLLTSICREIGATEYVSPPGSKDYLGGSKVFEDSGVKLMYFDFSHPIYKQKFGSFISHLSVVDMLFNVGPKQAACLIKDGIKE